ncbi:MAG: hypothetical protein Q8N60_02965, partial [Candidatus Diapherotrites archaeon]|nr:hypothetical protein [Candidatus Diapherotrites archaeon]
AISPAAESKNEIWKLEIAQPDRQQHPNGILEDVYMSFEGIGPYFSLTDNENHFLVVCKQTNNSTEACDSIDNDCDNEIDEDNACAQKCVDTPTLMNQYIPQWKSGAITMLALMQRMKLWNKAGCPA